jgi:hypothetical protein
MKMLRLATLGIALVTATSLFPVQAQVTWGAQTTTGIGDASGIELPVGDLVEIGTFNLTDSQIQQIQSDIPALTAAFTKFDTSVIGAGFNIPGTWAKESSGSFEGAGVAGKQIYYWIFNASTVAQATQQGIFTALSNDAWKFPSDATIPHTTVTDLAQVNDFIVGGFGTGTSSTFGTPLVNLAPIPEPSWTGAAYAVIGLGCVVGLRLHRVRSKSNLS